MTFCGFFYIKFTKLFICWKKWFITYKIFMKQKKLCCEWKTLLFVTDAQRRLLAALVKDKKEKIRQINFYCTVYTETTWNDFAESHRPHAKSHQLRNKNACGHTNSVPWMHAVCRLRQATFIQTTCVHSWYGVGVTGVTAFNNGTELMRFGKVALRSTKISIKWLWPVPKVTLKVIKRRSKVYCWSCDEGYLKWDKKFSEPQFTNTDRISLLSTPPPDQMVDQCL